MSRINHDLVSGIQTCVHILKKANLYPIQTEFWYALDRTQNQICRSNHVRPKFIKNLDNLVKGLINSPLEEYTWCLVRCAAQNDAVGFKHHAYLMCGQVVKNRHRNREVQIRSRIIEASRTIRAAEQELTAWNKECLEYAKQEFSF